MDTPILHEINEHTDLSGLGLGMVVNDAYIINDAKLCKASNGNPYLRAKLIDNSGSIPLIIWDYDSEVNEKHNGRIVYILGTVSVYNNQLQVSGEQIELATADKYNLSNVIGRIVPCAPIDVEDYIAYLYDKIYNIHDPDYYGIVLTLVMKYHDQFLSIPASKSIHHSFKHGLLMHTCNMLKLADAICETYGDEIYRDLLIAGIILHDIGKISEFEISEETCLVTGYSSRGNAVGHSVLGAIEVEEIGVAKNVDNEKISMLQHMLLSHHGKPEYGASKVPIIIEAEILHCLDMIDSRLEIYTENLINVAYGESSPYVSSLEKRLYRHYASLV